MLFKYKYPVNSELEKLNRHFVDFITNIITISATSRFNASKYCNSEFAKIISDGPVLKKKLISFFTSFKKLPQESRNEFYKIITKSQKIRSYFSDDSVDVSDLMSTKVIELLGNNTFNVLVNHLFKVTLKSFDIRGHYLEILNSMPHKVCPFCGVEKMHKSFQEDYDHLAAKKHYPTVAIHMENLAPMCHTCNSKNKGEKDVLHHGDKSRRKFIYPYNDSYDIKLDFSNCIIPQTDLNNAQGNWTVGLLPDDQITQTWDNIFEIKRRYKEDYLESNFEEWLDEFLEGLIFANTILDSEESTIFQLTRWSESLEKMKYLNTNFIKAPLFKFLSDCGIPGFYQSLIIRFNQKNAA
jgi:hypothetical protein